MADNKKRVDLTKVVDHANVAAAYSKRTHRGIDGELRGKLATIASALVDGSDIKPLEQDLVRELREDRGMQPHKNQAAVVAQELIGALKGAIAEQQGRSV